MKIALIGLNLSVGIRLIADTLGAALQRLGPDVLFVGEKVYQPPEGIPAVPISDGSSYGSIFRDTFRPALYREALAALERESPDICYFLTVHPANALLARSIRRKVRSSTGGRPLIAMHLHDPLPHPGIARQIIFATQELQVRWADRIVVYGSALASQVSLFYAVPKRHIITSRHGASRPPRESPPVPPIGYQWFSFLGRIEPYKGLEVFLAAARRVYARDSKSRFFVGGLGDITPYQEDLEALGDSVVVENREISNEETDEIMQASWAVVLPYTSATQSGVIPVAYWNGTPVIATRTGGLSEVVRNGETGFIVDPGDVAAVAECMLRLKGDRQLRRQLGAGAFSFYDRWLRWERIADDLLGALGFRGERYRIPEPRPAAVGELRDGA